MPGSENVFLNTELKGVATGDTWLALMEGATLEPDYLSQGKIEITEVKYDGIDLKDSTEKSGRKVTFKPNFKNEKRSPKYLIKHPALTPGPIKTFQIESDKNLMLLGQYIEIDLGGEKWLQIYSSGVAEDSLANSTSEFHFIIRNFCISMALRSLPKNFPSQYKWQHQKLLTDEPANPYRALYLKWAGDLNRDGNPDLIFNIEGDHPKTALYLSDPSGRQLLLDPLFYYQSGC
jgi:hypothetical protein